MNSKRNMMEHYDSEEDLYWGPVTLKEKKRDVLRKVSRECIKNRSTIGCDATFENEKSKRYEDVLLIGNQTLDNINISHTSDTQNFIEKVAKVLDITAPTDETSYFTAKDDVLGDNQNREETFKTAPMDVSTNSKTSNVSSDSNISISNIVEISSDLDYSILDQSLNKDLLTKQEILSEDSLNQSREDSSYEEQNYYKDLIINSEKLNISTSSEESLNEMPLPHLIYNNLEIIEEVDENTTNLETNPRIEIISSSGRCKTVSEYNNDTVSDSDENTNEESFKFNDTLEEMERLLSEGLNYTMSSNQSCNKLDKSYEGLKQAPIPKVMPIISTNNTKKNTYLTSTAPSYTTTTLNNIIPVRTPNKPLQREKTVGKSASKQVPFKSPTPSTTPLMKPFSKDRYKNIQSPVATYIKNSGKTPLLKTVTPSKPSNKENNLNLDYQTSQKKAFLDTSVSFPDVRYKSAKQKNIQTEEFKLPRNISTLIPIKANVAHHRERIGNKQLDKQLVDGDLTISTDISLNSAQDISIIDRKNVYI